MKIKLTINSNLSIRLDRYLRNNYPLITQGIIEKALRNKKIKLNEQKAKSNDRLQKGDVILVDQFLHDSYSSSAKSAKDFNESTIKLADKITGKGYKIFESEELIVINKPYGLAVQGGSKISLSVDDALSYLNYHKNTSYKLVHRLDKATSGVLVIAKSYEAASKLAAAFKDRLIKKKYIAVICGKPKQKSGVLVNKIDKVRNGEQELVQECTNGKIAETEYDLLHVSDKKSLIEYRPLTGRMHQLRVHSQLLGCSILGDVKYGGEKHKRMCLHALEINIPSEVLGYTVSARAKPDEEFIF